MLRSIGLLLLCTAAQRVAALHSAAPLVHRRTSPPLLQLGKDDSADLLQQGQLRAAAVAGASGLSLAATLPSQSDFWQLPDGLLADPVPLATLVGMGALVAAAWSAFGTDLHPITAKARGIEPPPALTFQVLGLSGVLLSSAAIGFGWYPLPVALSGVELAHCILPFALWQVDVLLLRWMMPHVTWADDATSLSANYRAEHESALNAALACLGVVWFEVYVQQMLAAPLTVAGWPLLASASLIALNAGLLNHKLANGLVNGIVCMEFYWTVSLMFGVSNSVLPVGIYHHLMYSMPKFVNSYDQGIEGGEGVDEGEGAARALIFHGALMAWHLALFSALSLAVPKALAQPLPALPEGFSLLPASAGAAFGLVCFGLFAANTAATVGANMQQEEA